MTMKKMFLAVLMGLALCFTLLSGTSSPASASEWDDTPGTGVKGVDSADPADRDAPTWWSQPACRTKNSTTCVSLKWSRQTDGAGVTLRGFRLWAPGNSCGLHNSDAWGDVTIRLRSPYGTKPWFATWDFSYAANTCDETFYTYGPGNIGVETGYMDAYVQYHSNIEGWWDDETCTNFAFNDVGYSKVWRKEGC